MTRVGVLPRRSGGKAGVPRTHKCTRIVRIPSHFTEWKYGTQSTESSAEGTEAGRSGGGLKGMQVEFTSQT